MSHRQILIAAMLALGCVSASHGQKLNPVQWTLSVEPASVAPGSKIVARAAAKIDAGWHIYSLTTPAGGPTPSTFKAEPVAALGAITQYQPKPHVKFDSNFKLNTEVFESEVVFLLEAATLADAQSGPNEFKVLVRYQACTDTQCLPRKANLAAAFTIDAKAKSSATSIPAGYSAFDPAAVRPVATPLPVSKSGSSAPQALGPFLAVAFLAGLAAIFTPCVFPMIPITLSFFLNRPGATHGDSLKQAIVFCLGIIVLFAAIGLSITALLGPFGVVQLGSNPWVNGFIALIFFVFGLSLLGAFEITLPSSLLTTLDRASQGSSYGATLLMGLTFCLTSFACVGPFVGTLLAASVQQGGIQPLLGMALFGAGLSSPFFFLALFPSVLKQMPRSGGWLGRVKVVLGFIVLAAMLKYLSSIDQVMQWNLLTRERFLAVWFVLFLLAGLYLLGFLRLEGIRPEDPLGVGRLLAGAGFLAFALSLVPGMFGSRLGELDAYVPLSAGTGLASGPGGAAPGLAWTKNQYREALDKARAENKLVFVNFTGYACTNCHWMKANMFTRPEIVAALNGFVLVELYTDGTDDVSEENQKLQETRFGTVAIPFYAIVTPDEKIVATSAGLTKDAPQFLAFLQSGAGQATPVQSAEARP